MQDHFTAPTLDTSLWSYYNMTTPCYMAPKRQGDSLLCLPEADRWNEGNCLLSRGFLNEQSLVRGLFAGWDEESGGAALGFYGGDGSFQDYVLLAATNDSLEIRVHSGCQNGAAFMDRGQPKWYAVSACAYEKAFPMKLALHRDGQEYTAFLNDRLVMQAHVPILHGDARAVFKGLPWQDRLTPRYAYLDWAQVEGFAPTASLCGRVTDASGRPIPGASVHLAGFDRFFTQTGDQGNFSLSGIPRGEHTLVAAAEGFSFACIKAVCHAGAANDFPIALEKETPQTLPRREYNNPSFDRSMNGWMSLNGTWQFAFDPEDKGVSDQWYLPDTNAYDKAIRVPFSWASLMGFGEEHLVSGDKLHQSNTVFNNYHLTGEYAWYRRSFTVPESFPQDASVILHIGACANVTYVWLDGRYMGVRTDEYSDLQFDLGRLVPGSRHTLAVKVQYPHDIHSHSMGKQIFWFASAPGIWQSVWIEPRNTAHITRLHLTPELSFEGPLCTKAAFMVDVKAENAQGMALELRFTSPEGKPVKALSLPVSEDAGRIKAEIPDPILWQYREGKLYTAEAKLISGGETLDTVRTYAGLRHVETGWLPGHSPADTKDIHDQYQYVYLNNRPFYVIGILDQCYNAFGIYTYRSLGEEGAQGRRGSIAYDIDRTLAYGYNLSRVHIKENEPLWYHECDRQGLPVWTEHPGNFYALPENPNWQSAYDRELHGMLERLHNHPSIMIVSTINESWGVEGRHTSTPWKNELRARFLEESAKAAKARWPHVLVCDNSGFGKTAACEINDFHYYPNDHWKARETWAQLARDCYPGSIHNYINEKRDKHCIGNAVQTGRPILVSEFLHINGIDMQLRMFEKIAGYLRMNIASYETEDSAPLTAERYERDYGFVDRHMRPLGYSMVNNMDMVVLDRNRIERAQAGQVFASDVYTSHFSCREASSPILYWSFTGIDSQGRFLESMAKGRQSIAFTPYCVERQSPISFEVPLHVKGGYLFAWVEDAGKVLCENYIGLEVSGTIPIHPENVLCAFTPAMYASKKFSGFSEAYVQGDRSLLWGCHSGEVEYSVTLSGGARPAQLIFEAGSREGVNAVKVTDELRHGAVIGVFLDGHLLGQVAPADDPSDERALFTNSALGGEPFNYMELGRFGYGERFALDIPSGLLTAGTHTILFRCLSGGMTLYGNRMGRFGFNPSIIVRD